MPLPHHPGFIVAIPSDMQELRRLRHRGRPGLAPSLIAAAMGGIFLPGDGYAGLRKPPWNPSNWSFGPAWAVLYVAMAIPELANSSSMAR